MWTDILNLFKRILTDLTKLMTYSNEMHFVFNCTGITHLTYSLIDRNMTKQYSNVNIDTDLTFKSIKSRFICGSYYRASFRASKKLVHHALTQFARGEKLKIDRENPIKKFHITPLPLPNIT